MKTTERLFITFDLSSTGIAEAYNQLFTHQTNDCNRRLYAVNVGRYFYLSKSTGGKINPSYRDEYTADHTTVLCTAVTAYHLEFCE